MDATTSRFRSPRSAAHAITEGAEGFLQSLPTAVLGTALNEKTWTEGNPLMNMLAGVGMGVGMGTFASGAIGGLTNLRGPKGVNVPEPGNIPAIQGRLVDLGTDREAPAIERPMRGRPGREHGKVLRHVLPGRHPSRVDVGSPATVEPAGYARHQP